jgi:hypothetical protein
LRITMSVFSVPDETEIKTIRSELKGGIIYQRVNLERGYIEDSRGVSAEISSREELIKLATVFIAMAESKGDSASTFLYADFSLIKVSLFAY